MDKQNGCPARVGVDLAVAVRLDVALRRTGRQHPCLGRLQLIDVEVQVQSLRADVLREEMDGSA